MYDEDDISVVAGITVLLYRDLPKLLPGNQIRKMHIGFAKVYSSPSQHIDDIMQKLQYLFDLRKRNVYCICKQRMKVKFTAS